ncbi:MAG: hypothetical protein DMG17_29340 [Acidobacteria bacterium]|nr:MAG: hypothetical protein DMG17_29340 [Acidobacteriota bacterium]
MPARSRTFPKSCEPIASYMKPKPHHARPCLMARQDTLAAVQAARIKTVLLSNKGNAGLSSTVQQFEIINYFDLILSADHVKHHKPSAALYTTHIAPVFPQGDPKNILVVGDTESDLRFANNIGAQSCWAAYGYGDASACIALAPTFTISGISELRGLLGC